jgi:hypothetical protein
MQRGEPLRAPLRCGTRSYLVVGIGTVRGIGVGIGAIGGSGIVFDVLFQVLTARCTGASADCGTGRRAYGAADRAAYESASYCAACAACAGTDCIVIAFGCVGCSSATGATDACAHGSTHRAADRSADESTSHSATGSASDFIGLVVTAHVYIAIIRAASGTSSVIALVVEARVLGSVLGCVRCALACSAAYGCADGCTGAHADRATDCADCRTCRSTGTAACRAAYCVAGFAFISRGRDARACRAADGSTKTYAHRTGNHAANGSACGRAAQTTCRLSADATVVINAGAGVVAVVGVVVHGSFIANVASAVSVEDVASRAFLSIGHASGHEYATALHACLIYASLFLRYTGVNQGTYESARRGTNASADQGCGQGSAHGQRAYAGDSDRANAHEEAGETAEYATAYRARDDAATAGIGLYYFRRIGRAGLHCDTNITCGDAAGSELLNSALRICGGSEQTYYCSHLVILHTKLSRYVLLLNCAPI